MSFEIDISNRQKAVPVDCEAIRAAILQALKIEQISRAVLSVSIVDNAAIHAVNRDHLQHDFPTDVVSFQLGFELNAGSLLDVSYPSELRARGAVIEGEIVASAEMAADMASEGRWSPQDELTLYVIHGLLHICGYDDVTREEQRIMRTREQAILSATGRQPIYHEESGTDSPT